MREVTEALLALLPSLDQSQEDDLPLLALVVDLPTSTKTIPKETAAADVERMRAEAQANLTKLPVEVADLLGASNRRIATKTLLEYGWRCGQGLRTGANDFFYVTRHAGGISTAPRWSQRTVTAPTETLLPTVRRQTDLSARLSVDSEHLDTLLVYLRGWATAHDRDEALRTIERGAARVVEHRAPNG